MRLIPFALVLCASCAPPGVAVADDPSPAPAHSSATVSSPTLLWTSPPTIAPTETPATMPTPALTAAPAPAPRASPVPTTRPTPTPDPFKWSGYHVLPAGVTLYVPATWREVPAGALNGYAYFAMSPEPAKTSLLGYHLVADLQMFKAGAGMTADAFTDSFTATVLHDTAVVRERIAHPAGTMVLVKYAEGADQQSYAFVVVNGWVHAVGLRTPLDRLAANAPIFAEILRRFVPG